MSEAQLQAGVMSWLRRNLDLNRSFFWKASDKFTAGIPDILGVTDGKMWAIELKFGKNKQTPLQRETMERLVRAGVTCGVCYTLDEVKLFAYKAGIKKEKSNGK